MMDGGSFAGGLTLTLVTAWGRVTDVTLRSNRPTALGRAFIGLGPDVVAQRLPLLFSVCGIAQQVAGLTALEAAASVYADPTVTACRGAAVHAESTVEAARGVVLAWSAFLGERPNGHGLAALAAGRDEFVTGLSRAAGWRHFGAGPITDGDRVRLLAGIAHMTSALAELGIDGSLGEAVAAGTLASLVDWARAGTGLTARTVAEVLDRGLPDFAAAPFQPLAHVATELAVPLSADRDGIFQARPTIDGRCYETGALAANATKALIEAVVEQYGHGLLARLIARLAELSDMAKRLDRLANDPCAGVLLNAETGPGRSGFADVTCARGRLVHWTRLADSGEVAAYRILAPTEWTFHPDGVLPTGLRGQDGAARADFEKHVALTVAAMDPCVACDIGIREAAHA